MEVLFEEWMKDEHPYFYHIVGFFQVLSIVAVITSFVLIAFCWWWWILTLSGAALFFLNIYVSGRMLDGYLRDFMS